MEELGSLVILAFLILKLDLFCCFLFIYKATVSMFSKVPSSLIFEKNPCSPRTLDHMNTKFNHTSTLLHSPVDHHGLHGHLPPPPPPLPSVTRLLSSSSSTTAACRSPSRLGYPLHVLGVLQPLPHARPRCRGDSQYATLILQVVKEASAEEDGARGRRPRVQPTATYSINSRGPDALDHVPELSFDAI
jgi:hypothetical protein